MRLANCIIAQALEIAKNLPRPSLSEVACSLVTVSAGPAKVDAADSATGTALCN